MLHIYWLVHLLLAYFVSSAPIVELASLSLFTAESDGLQLYCAKICFSESQPSFQLLNLQHRSAASVSADPYDPLVSCGL